VHTTTQARTIETAIAVWSQRFPSFVVFEHANAATGCGITHAHVHFVNVQAEARAAFREAASPSPLLSLSLLSDDRRELFWSVDSLGNAFVDTSGPFRSQFARRAIAKLGGVEFSTDWKAYTHEAWYRSSASAARTFAVDLRQALGFAEQPHDAMGNEAEARRSVNLAAIR